MEILFLTLYFLGVKESSLVERVSLVIFLKYINTLILVNTFI